MTTRKSSQPSRQALPETVYADVILRSVTGKSVLANRDKINPKTVAEFLPAPAVLERARAVLQELGFAISFGGPVHLTISGPRALFEEVFRTRLEKRSAPLFTWDRKKLQSHWAALQAVTIPPAAREVIEAVNFPGPVTYLGAAPPALAYDHMEVPQDIARGMDAIKAHDRMITGAGVKLAMVDSGFMNPPHAYYAARPYTIQATVSDMADSAPGSDIAVGHGTGIAACALATAPGCTFMPFKIYPSLGPASAAAAFSRAVNAGADIITCSWSVGPPADPTLQLAINNAVASGIVVCVSAGNTGPVGWPGSEPAVISVGGAFLKDDDSLTASSYASSGMNTANPGRQAPDVCGIVGQAPLGILIALPTEPGSLYDGGLSGTPYPNKDTTAPNDGWLVASGTSSASPMVAGVAALILQANPGFTPAQVRAALVNSCIDVTTGMSASSQPATPGPDLATGAGLVQAYRAIRSTDIWLKDNDTSDVGLVPTTGRRPSYPPHPFWTSPDIRVFDTDPGAVGFDSTPTSDPVYNQDNFVYVRVRNRGNQATGPVTVALYYADPHTGLVFPSDWNNGSSGGALGSITVSGITTNQQTVPSIPANNALVVPVPYVLRPPDPTLATETQTLGDGRTKGHYCLLVRTASADDPIMVPSGWNSVPDENNIGMRNVQVYSAGPGHDFLFTFSVSRPREIRAKAFDLVFSTAALPKNTLAQLTNKRGRLKGRWTNARAEGEAVRLAIGREAPRLNGLDLQPGQKVTVRIRLKLPAGTKAGDYSFEAFQLGDGRPFGGIRMTARLTQ